jgi:hypothetical protein
VKSGHFTRTDRATLRVSADVEGVSLGAVGYHHGSGMRGRGVCWGDAEWEEARAYVKVGRPCQMKLLNGHHLGGCHFKGRDSQHSTGGLNGLLEHPSLGHSLHLGRPLLVKPR